MSDFSRAGHRRPDRHAEPTPTGTRRAPPGTWPPTSAPRRSPSPRAPLTSPRSSASPPQNGLRVAGQGTGHGAVPLASLEDTILVKTERMRGVESTPRRATAAGRGRRALDRAGRGSWSARALLPARLLARRRRHRLHARRRPQLARPAVRLRLQPRQGDRAGHRRRASRRRSTPTTTPTCSGRCAAAAAATRSSPRCTSTCCRSPRSTPAPCSSRPRSAPRRSASTATGPPASPRRSPRSSASCARRRVPDVPEPIRDRPLLTIDARLHRQPRGGRSADRAAARDRRVDHGHLRPDPRRRPRPDPHGPRAAGPRPRQPRDDRASSPTRRSTPSSPDAGSGVGLAAAARRAAPARRRPGAAEPRGAAPSTSSTPPSSCSASACR